MQLESTGTAVILNDCSWLDLARGVAMSQVRSTMVYD